MGTPDKKVRKTMSYDRLVAGHKEKARENMDEKPAARGGRGITWQADAFQTWYAGEETEVGGVKMRVPGLAPKSAWEQNLSLIHI